MWGDNLATAGIEDFVEDGDGWRGAGEERAVGVRIYLATYLI
jgi:hypothetical protein